LLLSTPPSTSALLRHGYPAFRVPFFEPTAVRTSPVLAGIWRTYGTAALQLTMKLVPGCKNFCSTPPLTAQIAFLSFFSIPFPTDCSVLCFVPVCPSLTEPESFVVASTTTLRFAYEPLLPLTKN